jgi:hypothetical protein
MSYRDKPVTAEQITAAITAAGLRKPMSQPLTIAERNQIQDLIRKYTNSKACVECECHIYDSEDEIGESYLNDDCPHFTDAITLAKALEALMRGI